jgi:hypothetical protein
MLTLPADPLEDDPVRIDIMPLLPLFVVFPDVKDRLPDTAFLPELADLTLKAPLDFARP